MPITVRHTPVGALGRAALMAGQARAAQLQAGRDIQFTSMAVAAQERRAARGEAAIERRESRAFALQRAAAAQMARRRPDTAVQRQGLRRTVSEAEATGIYDPRQIKQMQIFADLGDVGGVRSILGRLPTVARPTVRQRELTRQAEILGKTTQKAVTPFRRQLTTVDFELGQRFLPETIQFLRENPQFADEETQKLLIQQQQLREKISKIEQPAEEMQRQIERGVTIPEQEKLRLKQVSEKQKVKIKAIQTKEKRIQDRLMRKITLNERILSAAYVDLKRAEKARKENTQFEKELKESYGRWDVALGIATPRQITPAEENDFMDRLLVETRGDVEAAKRLFAERSR